MNNRIDQNIKNEIFLLCYFHNFNLFDQFNFSLFFDFFYLRIYSIWHDFWYIQCETSCGSLGPTPCRRMNKRTLRPTVAADDSGLGLFGPTFTTKCLLLFSFYKFNEKNMNFSRISWIVVVHVIFTWFVLGVSIKLLKLNISNLCQKLNRNLLNRCLN